MAKCTRARSKAVVNAKVNAKRSRNVSASSFKSSSSEDEDIADYLTERDKYELKSWASKSTLRSLGTDKAKYSFRSTEKQLLTVANVGGGTKKYHSGTRSSNIFSNFEDVKSESNWGNNDEMISSRKGPKCFSRNAVMARLNRIKKKHYVESLENDFSKLSEENTYLKKSVSDQASTVLHLKRRVRYLESVLANSREISLLLKTVEKSTGLPTINSLHKFSKFSPSAMPKPSNQPGSRNVPHPSPNGFPPPQRDHMYSKTPDVVGEDVSFTTSEDIGDLPLSTSAVPAAEEDFDMGLMGYDDTLPFMPTNDIPEINLLTPESGDMFESNLTDFGQYLKDYQEDELFSNVGICLHIAERRVSLEFCETCNSSAVKAWSAESLLEDEESPVDNLLSE